MHMMQRKISSNGHGHGQKRNSIMYWLRFTCDYSNTVYNQKIQVEIPVWHIYTIDVCRGLHSEWMMAQQGNSPNTS